MRWILFILFFSFSNGQAAVRSVSKVVGEISDNFITSREVKINRAIDQVVTQKADFTWVSDQDKAYPDAIEQVLEEWSVYLEAKSLTKESATKAEVPKWQEKINQQLGRSEGWKSLEVSAEELRTILERKLIAQEFLKLKSESSLVVVTEEEALTYFKKNRSKFGSQPFEYFRENIQSFLVKQQTERRMRDWLDVLRRKYRLRNYLAT